MNEQELNFMNSTLHDATNKIMNNYSITLLDCPGLDFSERSTAENAYKSAIEKKYGGEAGVIAAYKEYLRVFNLYEETPLPACASEAENLAISKWEEIDNFGYDAAFRKWRQKPRDADFEINLLSDE